MSTSPGKTHTHASELEKLARMEQRFYSLASLAHNLQEGNGNAQILAKAISKLQQSCARHSRAAEDSVRHQCAPLHEFLQANDSAGAECYCRRWPIEGQIRGVGE